MKLHAHRDVGGDCEEAFPPRGWMYEILRRRSSSCGTAIGPLTIGDLPIGTTRELTAKEARNLRSHASPP